MFGELIMREDVSSASAAFSVPRRVDAAVRTTFISKGGPRAQQLVAGLATRYPVYEAGPGVVDVYSDDQPALFDLLSSVTPNWRMYLQVGEGAEGVGPWRGPPIEERTQADEPK